MPRITQYYEDLVSLFYPNICFVCDESLVSQEKYICTHCLLDLPRFSLEKPEDHILFNRFASFSQLDIAWSLLQFHKHGPAQKLLHKLKYEGQSELGIFLGKLLGQDIKRNFSKSEFDLIVPIPLHPSRLNLRGYNQSDKIAEGLSLELGVPYQFDNLIRHKKTKTQTKKSKVGRWQNVSEIYTLKSPNEFSGKHILLIDDVITTGATVSGAAELIVLAGAKTISFACLATEL